MRKKVLWDRVHRLEQEIAALMKIDSLVSSKVNEVTNTGVTTDASNIMQITVESQETTAPPNSLNQSMSITTIHPPPKERPRVAYPVNSAKCAPRPRMSNEVTEDERPRPVTAGQRKARSLPKYMQNRPTAERPCRPHSPFTATYKTEMRPNLDGEPLPGHYAEHGEGTARPEARVAEAGRAVSNAPDGPYPRVCAAAEARYAQTALEHCCDSLSCKYELVLQRLSEESRRRAEVEKMLRSVQERLDRSNNALHDANRARAAALDVAQQLRDKYEVLRNTRRQAQEHLQVLKTENANLAEQLEAEALVRKEMAGLLEGEAGAHQGLRQLLEDERRGRESLRGEAAAEATRAAELRSRVTDLEEQAAKERARVQMLEKEVAAERLKRRSLDDPELQQLLEGTLRPLREGLEEKTRALLEAEAYSRQLHHRLDDAEAEAKGAATAAAAAAASVANAEAAALARERMPLDPEDPAVRQVLAQETRHLADELQRCAEDARSQHARCDELERKLREQQTDEERRFRAAEEQFVRARGALADKEQLVKRERDELEQLVHDLTESLRAQKKRVSDLTDTGHKRDGLLRTQAEALASKDEQLRLASNEGAALRERAMALHKEASRMAETARVLRKANEDLLRRHDSPHHCSRCDALRKRVREAEEELAHWKAAVETERDNMLVKDKVLEDHTDTILRLKQQRLQEQETVARERQTLQYDLAQERRSTQKLRSDLAAVHRRCQQLQERADSLEEELATAVENNAQVDEQRRMLEELEEDVRQQRHVWEEQISRLTKEKEQALQVAQFNAKKLQETMLDFEQQMESHRKIQNMLTTHLSQKEKELEEANKTIQSMKRALDFAAVCARHMCLRADERMRKARSLCTGVWQELVIRA